MTHHLGLRLGDVLTHGDLREVHLALLVQPEPELLVLSAHAVERLHRGGLLGETRRFRDELLLDGLRLGGRDLLDRLGVGEPHVHESQALLLGSGGDGLLHSCGGEPLLLFAGGLSLHLLADHHRFSGALLLDRGGVRLSHPNLRETLRRDGRLLAFGQAHLGSRLLVCRFEGSLGVHQRRARHVLRRDLGGFGRLDVGDERLLGLGLRLEHRGVLEALGLGDRAQVLDALLFLGDRLVDGHSSAHDLGDLALLHLHLAVLVDAPDLGLALADDGLHHPRLLDALGLHRDLALTVLHRDFGRAHLRLFGDGDLFLVLLLEDLRALELLVVDPLRGVLLPRVGHGDLLVLLGLGVGALLLELEHSFVGREILAPDLHALLLPQLVGADVLARGDLRDLADALRVQDVLRIEVRDRRLLEIVDGRVLEHEAVQVLPDHVDDLVAELFALVVEVLEVELLADRLQRLGELRVEELLDGVLIRRAVAADRLRDLEHVFDGLVHPHEEVHLDVRADVVAADQALLAATIDLDRLDGDLHDLGAGDHGDDETAREGDLRLASHPVDDERATLIDLSVHLGDEGCQADAQHHDRADDGQHEDECFIHVRGSFS